MQPQLKGFQKPLYILFLTMQPLKIVLLCWALSVPPFPNGMCLAGGMLLWTLFIIFLSILHYAVLMSESEQGTKPRFTQEKKQGAFERRYRQDPNINILKADWNVFSFNRITCFRLTFKGTGCVWNCHVLVKIIARCVKLHAQVIHDHRAVKQTNRATFSRDHTSVLSAEIRTLPFSLPTFCSLIKLK